MTRVDLFRDGMMAWSWLLPFATILTAGGAAVWCWAWWPRRIGTTPHCRGCGYNLDGIESKRCPECGASLTLKNVVLGRRHRRRRAALVAVVMMLGGMGIAGVFIGQQLRRVDWYQHRPFAWLMGDLNRASEPLTIVRSWDELLRRAEAGLLSDSQYQAMIERALAEQTAAVRTPATGP